MARTSRNPRPLSRRFPNGLCACAAALVPLALVLSGCSGMPATTATAGTSPVQGAAITGKVHGGRQPITGASVYLYAVNTAGYGSANSSLSLLNSNVLNNTTPGGYDGTNYYATTDSNGNFTITGDYTCPSTTSQVYLYSIGGNPGGGTNSGAGLVALLGTCPAGGTLSSSLYVVVNEVSTVAAAEVLAGTYVANDWKHLSIPPNDSLAQAGIANAFATVTNLETLSTGVALATTPTANGGNGTVPQEEINTLANILAACVNSSGPGSSACSTLFSDWAIVAETTTDTAQAAIAGARNPQAHLATVYALAVPNSPFEPSLTAQPNDFTVDIVYTGGGLDYPYGLAVDGSGNVWVANAHGNSLSEFNPLGKALSGSSGYTGGGLNGPAGLAIDASGNVWAANYGDGTGINLSEYSPSTSTWLSPSTGLYTGGGLKGAYLLAMDQAGSIWVSNDGADDISEFSSGGMAVSGSNGLTGGDLNDPIGIAIDVSGNVWAANSDSDNITEYTPSDTTFSSFTGGGIDDPGDMAIDSSGNVWAANAQQQQSQRAQFFRRERSPARHSAGGGLNSPAGLAISGFNGYLYVANNGGNSISVFSSTGSVVTGDGTTGWQGAMPGTSLSAPIDVAFDGAGNLWVTNSGNNTITEMIGRGLVVTPIVANLLTPYGSHAVNRP